MSCGPDLIWGASVKESETILDRFFASGGNFVDTADVYMRGHSEKILGDHLGRHSPSVVLAGVLHEAANRAKTLPYMPLPTQPVPTNPFKYHDPADD